MKLTFEPFVLALGALCFALAGTLIKDAGAHEVRPAYLLIQQTAPERFDVLWRVPARGELRLGIYAQLPEHCKPLAEPRVFNQNAILVERWTAHCLGGLSGHSVYIEGLSATLTDVLARFERLDGTTQVSRLTPSEPSFVVTDAQSWLELATTYGILGFEHILLGVDHLLFVLALLIIVSGFGKLVATVTAFTLAHSLTLGAATLGWVNVPQSPVEAVIALSILFVAIEIVHWKQGRPGITRRKPWLVAFVFGLLHGFGFAGALSEIGLPEHAIPLALLFFNLGVESGQLAFIVIAYGVWWALGKIQWPESAWRIPVYGIGAMAGFWTIERLSGF